MGKLGAVVLGHSGVGATSVEYVIEMELVGVRVELPSSAPIVLLREAGEHGRLLPIFIGGPEATAIALAMDEVETPRPMTHDLFKSVLDALAVRTGTPIFVDERAWPDAVDRPTLADWTRWDWPEDGYREPPPPPGGRWVSV